YANREAVALGTIATSVPLGVERLLWYRKRF
ncbi:phage gp6-like head-tail connector protein, partial [Pseudomonas aeruginosa]